ncbi:MAG: A24 family peptidase, partial [Pseudomonadota bacterium]
CTKAISPQYPLIELSSTLLAVLCLHTFGLSTLGLLAYIFCSYLLILSAIDFATQWLPDELTLSLLWIGLLCSTHYPTLFCSTTESIYGAALGYGTLWFTYHGYYLCTGKEGLGFGDLKLLAAMGAWLGMASIPWILLIGATLGSAVGLTAMAVGKRSRHDAIPFGPFLSMGALLVLFLQTSHRTHNIGLFHHIFG